MQPIPTNYLKAAQLLCKNYLSSHQNITDVICFRKSGIYATNSYTLGHFDIPLDIPDGEQILFDAARVKSIPKNKIFTFEKMDSAESKYVFKIYTKKNRPLLLDEITVRPIERNYPTQDSLDKLLAGDSTEKAAKTLAFAPALFENVIKACKIIDSDAFHIAIPDDAHKPMKFKAGLHFEGLIMPVRF